MSKKLPRLDINLSKIRHNCERLVESLGNKGLSVTGVTKAVLGCPKIAEVMLDAGVQCIGDSRIENIIKMREAGIQAKFVLLRTPSLSAAQQVVEHSDVSHNTEFDVIVALSKVAEELGKIQSIVLMVELGDLREGILKEDLLEIFRRSNKLPGIRVIGLGTNLACLGGVKPTSENMKLLSDIASEIEKELNLKLEILSGGNSANLNWAFKTSETGLINNLRLGESILLGCETLNRTPIDGLHTDAFTLVGEVIESKIKPTMPFGERSQNAFGEEVHFEDRGLAHHVILGIGRQDVLISGIKPMAEDLKYFGASSDHLVLISKDRHLKVGEEVSFEVNYGALVAAMTSPYVQKVYAA